MARVLLVTLASTILGRAAPSVALGHNILTTSLRTANIQDKARARGMSSKAPQHANPAVDKNAHQVNVSEGSEKIALIRQSSNIMGSMWQKKSHASMALTFEGIDQESFKEEWTHLAVEFIATALLIVMGCGTAMLTAKQEAYAWTLQVSLAFGFATSALEYTLGLYGSGHMNPAITLGMLLTQQMSPQFWVVVTLAQLFGAVFGASLLTLMIPAALDRTGSLAINAVIPGYSPKHVVIMEAIMTCLVTYVALYVDLTAEAAGTHRNISRLSTGLAVFAAHSVLLPIDGCSINPARSIGTAIIAKRQYTKLEPFGEFWVFTAGPYFGAVMAVGLYYMMTWLP